MPEQAAVHIPRFARVAWIVTGFWMPLDKHLHNHPPPRSLAHPADLYLIYEQGKWYLPPAQDRLPARYAMGKKSERGGCFFLGICVREEKAIGSVFASLAAAFQQASQTAGIYRHRHTGRTQLLSIGW